MFHSLKTFITEEDGVVTVEFVVTAAAITWLCLGAISTVQGGVHNLAAALEQDISVKAVEEN